MHHYYGARYADCATMSGGTRDDIDRGLLATPGAFSTTSSLPDSRDPPSSMRSVDVEEGGELGNFDDELDELGNFKPSPLSDKFDE